MAGSTDGGRAKYGRQMRWHRQRRKQEAAAENRDERLNGEILDPEEVLEDDDSS